MAGIPHLQTPSPNSPASWHFSESQRDVGTSEVWDLASKHVLFQMDPMKAAWDPWDPIGIGAMRWEIPWRFFRV
jgi:hypothetical protein